MLELTGELAMQSEDVEGLEALPNVPKGSKGKLVVTSASLLVTSALLVVTKSF